MPPLSPPNPRANQNLDHTERSSSGIDLNDELVLGTHNHNGDSRGYGERELP